MLKCAEFFQVFFFQAFGRTKKKNRNLVEKSQKSQKSKILAFWRPKMKRSTKKVSGKKARALCIQIKRIGHEMREYLKICTFLVWAKMSAFYSIVAITKIGILRKEKKKENR